MKLPDGMQDKFKAIPQIFPARQKKKDNEELAETAKTPLKHTKQSDLIDAGTPTGVNLPDSKKIPLAVETSTAEKQKHHITKTPENDNKHAGTVLKTKEATKRVNAEDASKESNDEDEPIDIKKFFQFYKKTQEVKLTIILVENTSKVVNEAEKIKKIVKSLVTKGYVIVINYGSTVNQTEPIQISEFDYTELVSTEDASESACLYDALSALESIVEVQYKKITEFDDKKEEISEIEVIGIGNCIDNCSKVTQKTGIDCFCKVISKPKIVTKYFGITEEAFIPAATVGFHSIGAIVRSFGNEQG